MPRQFCSIRYPDGLGFNTEAASLFAAAANALRWSEVECQTFGTARRYRDDQTLLIHAGMVDPTEYRVSVGRVRQWIKETDYKR